MESSLASSHLCFNGAEIVTMVVNWIMGKLEAELDSFLSIMIVMDDNWLN